MTPSCQAKARTDWPAVWRFFAWLGCVSFGGPAGQIAILREELVERRRWLSAREFSDGLSFCLLLPGPEAHQLVIYSGWKLHGLRGALVAGTLFVVPAALLLWLLTALYAVYGNLLTVRVLFEAVQPAVLAIILTALVKMGRHHLHGARAWILAGSAFVAMFFFQVPFPWIVVAALGLGAIRHLPQAEKSPEEPVPTPEAARATPAAWRVVGLGVLLWATPVAVAAAIFGADGVVTALGVFFSKVAVVTFGGAYAVLPYVADHATGSAHWLTPAAMKDGLALAETTPGPLVIVLQFVGFLAGWNHAGTMPPLLMATLGAAITSWVTFVPSFIFILVGAPHVERLSRSARARNLLSSVTAAVIGVIANLAAWFASGIFAPGQPAIMSSVIAGTALWLLMARGWSIPAVIGLAAGAGLGRLWLAGV